MDRLPSYLFAALAGLIGACGSSSSGISSGGSNDGEEAAVLLLSTTAGGLSTTGGVLMTVANSDPPPSIWLANRRQIRIDIARGHGAWVNDLAAELGLPEGLVPYLGEALKRRREPLAALLARKPLSIEDWERTLGDALCCDPWLHPFSQARFRCRAPAAGVMECTP